MHVCACASMCFSLARARTHTHTQTHSLGVILLFHNPEQGAVYLDGHDLRTLDAEWLREHVAVVHQEPGALYCSPFACRSQIRIHLQSCTNGHRCEHTKWLTLT